MGLGGTWRVVPSLDFDDDCLNVPGPVHVTLRQNGRFLRGEYEIQRYAVVLDLGLIGCLVQYRGCHGPFSFLPSLGKPEVAQPH
jgi:hypothetical protein